MHYWCDYPKSGTSARKVPRVTNCIHVCPPPPTHLYNSVTLFDQNIRINIKSIISPIVFETDLSIYRDLEKYSIFIQLSYSSTKKQERDYETTSTHPTRGRGPLWPIATPAKRPGNIHRQRPTHGLQQACRRPQWRPSLLRQTTDSHIIEFDSSCNSLHFSWAWHSVLVADCCRRHKGNAIRVSIK